MLSYYYLSGTIPSCFIQKLLSGSTVCNLLNTLFTVKLDAEKGMISSVIHILGYTNLLSTFKCFTQIFLKSIAAYIALTKCSDDFHFESIFVSLKPGFIKGSLKCLVDTFMSLTL